MLRKQRVHFTGASNRRNIKKEYVGYSAQTTENDFDATKAKSLQSQPPSLLKKEQNQSIQKKRVRVRPTSAFTINCAEPKQTQFALSPKPDQPTNLQRDFSPEKLTQRYTYHQTQKSKESCTVKESSINNEPPAIAQILRLSKLLQKVSHMAEKAEWNHITRVFDKKSTASTRELVEALKTAGFQENDALSIGLHVDNCNQGKVSFSKFVYRIGTLHHDSSLHDSEDSEIIPQKLRERPHSAHPNMYRSSPNSQFKSTKIDFVGIEQNRYCKSKNLSHSTPSPRAIEYESFVKNSPNYYELRSRDGANIREILFEDSQRQFWVSSKAYGSNGHNQGDTEAQIRQKRMESRLARIRNNQERINKMCINERERINTEALNKIKAKKQANDRYLDSLSDRIEFDRRRNENAMKLMANHVWNDDL